MNRTKSELIEDLQTVKQVLDPEHYAVQLEQEEVQNILKRAIEELKNDRDRT